MGHQVTHTHTGWRRVVRWIGSSHPDHPNHIKRGNAPAAAEKSPPRNPCRETAAAPCCCRGSPFSLLLLLLLRVVVVAACRVVDVALATDSGFVGNGTNAWMTAVVASRKMRPRAKALVGFILFLAAPWCLAG